MVSAGEYISVGILIVVLVLGLQFFDSFADSTTNTCVEQYNTTLVCGAFAGSYSNTTLLPYYIPGYDGQINTTGIMTTLTVGGCSLTPGDSVTVPASCMAQYLTVVFDGTVDNVTVTHKSLGNCSMDLNSYNALKNTTNIINPVFEMMPVLILLLFMAVFLPTMWGALQRD
jgi:hypothetical protein